MHARSQKWRMPMNIEEAVHNESRDKETWKIESHVGKFLRA